MVFFLYYLARKHDFAVDFAHPIDQRLANYLQSPECIDALARGGALQVLNPKALNASPASSVHIIGQIIYNTHNKRLTLASVSPYKSVAQMSHSGLSEPLRALHKWHRSMTLPSTSTPS